MSELTSCNHCSLEDMRKRRGRTGETVHKVPCGRYGGFDLFITKKGEKAKNVQHAVSGIYDGIKDTRCISDNAVWAAWMEEIGSSCGC